jgi:hypothetical protein
MDPLKVLPLAIEIAMVVTLATKTLRLISRALIILQITII